MVDREEALFFEYAAVGDAAGPAGIAGAAGFAGVADAADTACSAGAAIAAVAVGHAAFRFSIRFHECDRFPEGIHGFIKAIR